MKPAEWLRRLEEAFGTGPFLGPELLPVVNAEREYGTAAERQYSAFLSTATCLESLFLEALSVAEQSTLAKRGVGWFRPILLSFAGSFRILRAAEILFLTGYPLNAYAVLRDLKDRAIAYGAIINKYVSFEELNGWNVVIAKPGEYTWEHFKITREARKKADRAVFKRMIGAESGLPKATSLELQKWNDSFPR